MPTALPASTDFTGSGVTEGGFKTALTSLRDYLAGLFGTDGAVATALATLGAAATVSPTFTGTPIISEALKLTGVISPTQITADQNDYAPAGFSTALMLRINSDAARTVTGLAAGASGRAVTLINVGSFPILFASESAASSAANRFLFNRNVILAAGMALTLWYDATSSRWRAAAAVTSPDASQTLTDGVTINWDTALGNIGVVTLGGNRTMAAPTGLVAGTYLLHLIQDATGSRTITWNTIFKFPAGVAPPLSTGANKRDILSFVCDGTNLYGSYMLDVR